MSGKSSKLSVVIVSTTIVPGDVLKVKKDVTIVEGEVPELPRAYAENLIAIGSAREATEEEVAAAKPKPDAKKAEPKPKPDAKKAEPKPKPDAKKAG